MRYKIGKDSIIRSENAAKPDTQSSAYLNKLISRLEPVHSSFDFGCGKLRYERAIAKTTEELALIDSEVQLSRTQMIRGRSTTIRDHVRKANHVHAYTVGQFAALVRKYDRGFCINVLSVIPSASVRLGIVQLMRTKLKPGCPCLFVSLYRNSDFTRMQKLPNCTPYGNGFLMDSLRGHSFYGLIPPNDLAFLVKRGGFEVESVKLDEGTAYLWAKSPEKATEPNQFEIRETAELSDSRHLSLQAGGTVSARVFRSLFRPLSNRSENSRGSIEESKLVSGEGFDHRLEARRIKRKITRRFLISRPTQKPPSAR
jgi:hypothetical protein